jgi:hypothetical protein
MVWTAPGQRHISPGLGTVSDADNNCDSYRGFVRPLIIRDRVFDGGVVGVDLRTLAEETSI